MKNFKFSVVKELREILAWIRANGRASGLPCPPPGAATHLRWVAASGGGHEWPGRA